MYYSDAHTHSRHSVDGYDAMPALCGAAIAAGLSSLCVTDHCDVYSQFDAAAYLAEYQGAREACAGRLSFALGVELGEGHFTPERSAALLETVPFDFVLGSCHYIKGHPDFYDIRYEDEAHCRRLIVLYLDELLRMIAWGSFDVLGHLTYPLRYMRAHDDLDGLDVDFMFYEDRVRAVFRALVEGGHGLEVNVSGLRRGGFAMPDLPLLKLYRDSGGEIVTVGSDAHRATDVGANVADGYALLVEAGFSYVSVFRKRKPDFMKL